MERKTNQNNVLLWVVTALSAVSMLSIQVNGWFAGGAYKTLQDQGAQIIQIQKEQVRQGVLIDQNTLGIKDNDARIMSNLNHFIDLDNRCTKLEAIIFKNR